MTASPAVRLLRWCATLTLALVASGCVSTTVKTVRSEPLATAGAVPEAQLMDVGVLLFDPNIPQDWKEREQENVLPDVRRAEARFMPQVLKATLETSGNWGAVRVLPRETTAVDLTVAARILHSDGERLALDVTVTDASGRVWIDHRYDYTTSKYAYAADAPPHVDPFQPLYTDIANDMLKARQQLTDEQRTRIRQIADIRFAREFAPEAFDGYLQQDRDGRWTLLRLPADSDPMVARIRSIRQREDLFIDTLDEYYSQFRRDVQTSYQDYRKFSYSEAQRLHQARTEARRRTLFGALAVVGGVAAAVSKNSNTATRTGGAVAVLGGATLLKSALGARSEAQLHAEAIRELGTSLEQEVSPHVIELDDRTVTLTGSVDEQYDQWRGILRKLYRAELGLPESTPGTPDADASAGSGSGPAGAGS